ncbi:MAG: hypothetical protein EOP24_26680 [Hyphomicrobiales bacterium]|nr:MAG: hypothetical protein EOP24_26680 [Hyphomicrobiales bacterium]
MADLSTAITAISASVKMLMGAVDARDNALIQKAQYEVQEQLRETLTTSFSQLQTMNALELEAQTLRRQLVEADSREQKLIRELEERSAYRRAQPAPGKWAYVASDQPDATTETTAYFCAACHAEGKHVVLQYHAPRPGIHAFLECAIAQAHRVVLGGALPSSPKPPRYAVQPTPRW